MANSAFARYRRRDGRGIDVDRVAHLSRWHADDWKEGVNSRGVALGETGLTIADFGLRIADLSCFYRERAH